MSGHVTGHVSRDSEADQDHMDLYHVFQTSYNKIAKSEYSSRVSGNVSSDMYPAHGHSDIYQHESRFFPLEPSVPAKSEKQDPSELRQWSSFPDGPHTAGVLPSLPGYSDPSLYYHEANDWGYPSGSTYPSSSFLSNQYPSHNYNNQNQSSSPSSLLSPSSFSSRSGPGASPLSPLAHANHSSFTQHHNIDDAINILRGHSDFQQVLIRIFIIDHKIICNNLQNI